MERMEGCYIYLHGIRAILTKQHFFLNAKYTTMIFVKLSDDALFPKGLFYYK